VETEKHTNVGYLGVNWEADGSYYKIKQIIRGAPWDAESRSSAGPLPGGSDPKKEIISWR